MALNTHTANVFLPGCLGPVRREIVLADEAEAELAALREELATAKRNEHNSEVAYKAAIEKQEELRDRKNSIVDLQQRLTAAEQRNSALETAIRHTLDDSSEDAQTGEITIMRLDYETLVALIDEPTESGASE